MPMRWVWFWGLTESRLSRQNTFSQFSCSSFWSFHCKTRRMTAVELLSNQKPFAAFFFARLSENLFCLQRRFRLCGSHDTHVVTRGLLCSICISSFNSHTSASIKCDACCSCEEHSQVIDECNEMASTLRTKQAHRTKFRTITQAHYPSFPVPLLVFSR